MFRVWETSTWKCEKWENLDAPVRTACWSPNSRLLTFALENSSAIVVLQFGHAPPRIGGYHFGTTLLSQVDISVNSTQLAIGGNIQEIAWDHTGRRIAVAFEESAPGSELIAVFEPSETASWNLSLHGFVRGPPTESSARTNVSARPGIISFRPNFPRGALLAVAWSTGKLSFYPLYFAHQLQ